MDMKYKEQSVLHVVNILLFKKCLLWTHLYLSRKHLEVIKCICARPDWLTDWLWKRSGKGVSGLTENKGRGWRLDSRSLCPCSSESAHICHYAISASIQQGSSLRKCTQSIRLTTCRQREGGPLNWRGIIDACEHQQKVALTYQLPPLSHRGKCNHVFSCKAECRTTSEK